MRNSNSFGRTNETVKDKNKRVSWLDKFADRLYKAEQTNIVKTASKTAVEVARERSNISVYELMSSIINPKKSKYSSVEEAVEDYQKRTGLSNHLKQTKLQVAAKAVKASAKDEDDESEDEEEDEEDNDKEDKDEEETEEEGDDTDPKDEYVSFFEGIDEILNDCESNDTPCVIHIDEDIIDSLFGGLKNSKTDKGDDCSCIVVSLDQDEDENDVRWDESRQSLVAESLISKAGQDDNLEVGVEYKLPEIIVKNPAIANFITNIIETNHGIQVPALLHSIVETFGRDGINQQIFSDKDLLEYINNIILNKNLTFINNTSPSIGKGVGISVDNSGSIDSNKDPFILLTPINQ